MQNKMLQAAITAIAAMGIASTGTEVIAANNTKTMTKANDMEKCYGIVKAGMNDCGTSANNACAGSSTVDGDKSAWIFLPKGTCDKIIGSSKTPPKA